MRKRYRTGLLGIWAGAATIFLVWLCGRAPQLVESGYSRGIFQVVRMCLDLLLAYLPFPASYLFFAWLLWLLLRGVVRRVVQKDLTLRWGRMLRTMANSTGWLLAGFFWMWGFNYLRVPVDVQLGLKNIPLDGATLTTLFKEQTAQLLAERASFEDAKGRALDTSDMPAHVEDTLRNALEQVLQASGYPTNGRVRGKRIYPAGILLRFSTAGVYFPFTGEGHIDAGLHALQQPYTLAHELAHGYGFGNEGVCNFWAYLACMETNNALIRYSARLSYWRYIAREYRRYDPQGFEAAREVLSPEIMLDLEAIQRAMDKYPDLIPRLQYQIYDQYLKTQGIKEGMLSYNEVLTLVHAWELKYGSIK